LNSKDKVATLKLVDMTARKNQGKTGAKVAKQGAKFGLVGLSNAVIDFTLYTALTVLLKVPLDKVFLVKYFSGSCAMVNSFYWNRNWTFKSKANIVKSGPKFLIATLISVWAIQPSVVWFFTATVQGKAFGAFWFMLGKTIGIVGLLPHTLTLPFIIKTVAFGMSVLTILLWDFSFYKFWAFKDN
jgi:putative flippase GtrA